MPVVWKSTVKRDRLNTEEVPSLPSEVLRETFAQTYEEAPFLPGGMFDRSQELTEAEGVQVSRGRPVNVRRINAAQAMERVKKNGLEGHLTFDKDTTEEAVDLLSERKRKELYRQDIAARSPGGFGLGTAKFGMAVGTSLADPGSALLNFVPVIGQTRYLRWLRIGGSALGRAGVRAGVGAAEGVAGATLYEPLLYTAKQSEQADYDMTDSLLNVAFGGVLGGGIHMIGGASADAYRALRGLEQPWAEKTALANAITAAIAAREGGLKPITPEMVDRGGKQLDDAIDASLGAAAEPVTRIREVDSVKSGAAADEGGYSVSEGVLTDEQLATFQGLRSDVQANQNVGGSRGRVPESERAADAGRQGTQAGDPLTVHRGSDQPLSPEHFQDEALGFASGHPSSGLGVFFTNDRADASRYGRVESVNLDIRNPKVLKVEDLPDFDSLDAARLFRNRLRAEGFDGIVIDMSHLGGPTQYVAFDHAQVVRPDVRPRNAAEHAGQANLRTREAALRIATTQLAEGDEVRVGDVFPESDNSPTMPDTDTAQAKSDAADAEIREGDDTLEAAEEAALLEEKLTAQQAKLMDVDIKPLLEAAENEAQRIDMYARAAELAQACLVRGG
jgi:hypothetical protein